MKHKQLQELIGKLKAKGYSEKVNLFVTLAKELEKPTRRTRVVNLIKLEKFSKDDEIVIVPGKVLANGEITRKVRVAAKSFSQSAVEKIKSQNGEVMTFNDLLNMNIKGQKIRIIG